MLGRFPGPVLSVRPSGGTASLSWRCSTPFVGWRRFSAPALRAQDTRSPRRPPPPPGRGAGDPNASSALPAVAGGVPDPPVPPIVDVVDVDEVAHRPLLLVSDICGLTTVTRGPLTGRGLSLRDYSREVAGYRVLEDWAGALILRCRRWCAGQAGIEAPPDIEGASWGSKELLVRDEDVQVLHGFETLEQANAYLTSELFTTKVVPGLTPLFKADPDIRVYTVA